jgi:PLP dependent protein
LAFGENYVQEGVDKIAHFAAASATLTWHFIGPLQSNKSRLVAENFDWCHTIDRLRIAQRLNEQRPAGMPPLHVLIQVNISDEASKSGMYVVTSQRWLRRLSRCRIVQLRGLMAIPAQKAITQSQLEVFGQMRDALANATDDYPAGGHAVDGHDR